MYKVDITFFQMANCFTFTCLIGSGIRYLQVIWMIVMAVWSDILWPIDTNIGFKDLCLDLMAWITVWKERKEKLSMLNTSIKSAQTHGSVLWQLKFKLYKYGTAFLSDCINSNSYHSPCTPGATHQSNKIFWRVFFGFKKFHHSRFIETIHMMQLEHIKLQKLCIYSILLNSEHRYVGRIKSQILIREWKNTNITTNILTFANLNTERKNQISKLIENHVKIYKGWSL